MAKFEEYFNEIDLSRTVRSRVKKFLDIYTSLFPDLMIEGVFLSNAEDEYKKQVFQSLWFWGGVYTFECHNFQLEEKYDAISAKVTYWRVTSTDYTMGGQSTPDSKMRLEISFGSVTRGEMTATGKNCEYLEEFLRSHVLGLAAK